MTPWLNCLHLVLIVASSWETGSQVDMDLINTQTTEVGHKGSWLCNIHSFTHLGHMNTFTTFTVRLICLLNLETLDIFILPPQDVSDGCIFTFAQIFI